MSSSLLASVSVWQSFVLGICFNSFLLQFSQISETSHFMWLKLQDQCASFLTKLWSTRKWCLFPSYACATVSMTSRNFATDPNTRTNTIIFHAKCWWNDRTTRFEHESWLDNVGWYGDGGDAPLLGNLSQRGNYPRKSLRSTAEETVTLHVIFHLGDNFISWNNEESLAKKCTT